LGIAILLGSLTLRGGPAHADLLDGVAALGDSGTAGGSVTNSWVPVLANERGIDFGGSGNPYNVAVGGATTTSLLNGGQHTEVRDLVLQGDVTLPILFIGSNDLHSVPALNIISGSATPAQRQAFIDGLVGNILTAANTILAAGPEGFVLMGLGEGTIFPGGRIFYDNPVTRDLAYSVVDDINDQLRDFAIQQSIVFVDTAALMRDHLATGPLLVGGVEIDTLTGNSDPDHFFKDQIHPGAVGNGVLANVIIEGINLGYAAGITPLTDLEILELAGLEDQYTGETLFQDIEASQYIYGVPEPSTLFLAGFGLLALLGSARGSRRTPRP
jgi:lysophospholipase L1-like esterase